MKADFTALSLVVANALGDGRAAFLAVWGSKQALAALKALTPVDVAAIPPLPLRAAPNVVAQIVLPGIEVPGAVVQQPALGAPAGTAAAASPTPVALAPIGPAADTLPVPPVFEPRLNPASLDALQRKTTGDLWRDTRTQTIGVALVVTWASYAVFSGHFIGTAGEVFGLFVWGFSSDLSVSGLTTLITPLKAKTA